jgi:GcrA cell cycle regulator
MNWTDERVELLRKLWAEGLSASQISAQLGGVTRNAVIGKVHRLKLSSRGRASTAPSRPKKPASTNGHKPVPRPVAHRSNGANALQPHFEADVAPRPHFTAAAPVVVPISRHLKLVELTERTCKWPNGDPLHEDFSFCGNDSAEAGPYCAYHSRIAFQPASERRRSR